MLGGAMLGTYLSVAGANFLFIFLKAYQQRNVAFDNYGMVLPTSFGLALTEVYVIAKVAVLGFTVPLALTIGCAAGSGALCAMLLHKHFHMKPEITEEMSEWQEEGYEERLELLRKLGAFDPDLRSSSGTQPQQMGLSLSTNQRMQN